MCIRDRTTAALLHPSHRPGRPRSKSCPLFPKSEGLDRFAAVVREAVVLTRSQYVRSPASIDGVMPGAAKHSRLSDRLRALDVGLLATDISRSTQPASSELRSAKQSEGSPHKKSNEGSKEASEASEKGKAQQAKKAKRSKPKRQSAASQKGKAKRCLLYTSPSPRDQRGSRMPSSA